MINERTLILCTKICIIILTALLNGIIIYIFTVQIKRRTFSDYIYLSITLSDFIIGFMSMSTQTILDQYDNWPFDRYTCFLSIYLQYAIPDTTILALLILAIHIYIQLTSHSKFIEKFSIMNLLKLTFPWFIATLFWISSITYFVYANKYCAKKCNIEPSLEFKLFKVLTFGFLPLLSIIFINILSIKELNHKTKKLKLPSNRQLDLKLEQNSSFINSSTSVRFSFKPKYHVTCLPNFNIKSLIKSKTETSLAESTKVGSLTSRNFMEMKKTRYKKVVLCILALSFSITLTQVLYLTSWPFYDTKNKDTNKPFVRKVYKIGVWLSYLTSLFNPTFLFIFNEKVKRNLKKIFGKNQIKSFSIRN